MQNYELTLVLPEKVTAARKKSVTDLVEKIVKTFKGKVLKTDDWGRIDLAYKVKKNSSGSFMHFDLELEPKSVHNLDAKIRLEESVIRYLLVRKEKNS